MCPWKIRPLHQLAVSLVLLLAATSAALAVDQFNVYLAPSLPDTIYAGVNSTVAVTLEVDSTAKEFNGFEVQIQSAPSVLTFQGATEGALFPGACPDRFTPISQTDSTVTFGDFLFCNNVSANGPGTLAVYTFAARNPGISPVTIISDPNRSFYDAGLDIWPQNPTYPRQVVYHNAVVKVVNPTSRVASHPATSSGSRLGLGISPNPIRDQGKIRVTLPLGSTDRSAAGRSRDGGSSSGPGPVQVIILTATGRVVASWGQTTNGLDELVIPWRAVDQADRPLPAGAYFCRLRSGTITATGRFLVVR